MTMMLLSLFYEEMTMMKTMIKMVTSIWMICMAGTCFCSIHSSISDQANPQSCQTVWKTEYIFLHTYVTKNVICGKKIAVKCNLKNHKTWIDCGKYKWKWDGNHVLCVWKKEHDNQTLEKTLAHPYRICTGVVIAECSVFYDHGPGAQLIRKCCPGRQELLTIKKTMFVVYLLCKQWQWHHDTNKTLFAPDTSSGSRPSRRWWKRWASPLGSGRCWTRPPCPARPGGRRPPWPPRGWRWGDHWIARRQPLCRSGKKNLNWKKDSLSKDDLVGGDEQLRDRLVLCLAVDEHLRNTTILYWCSKILTFVSDLRNHMKKNHEIWETIWKTSTRVWKILEDVIDVRKDIALAMNWKPYEREPRESKKWRRAPRQAYCTRPCCWSAPGSRRSEPPKSCWAESCCGCLLADMVDLFERAPDKYLQNIKQELLELF